MNYLLRSGEFDFFPGCFGGDLGSNIAIIRVVFTSLSEPILLKIQGGEAIYKQTPRVEAGRERSGKRRGLPPLHHTSWRRK